jgi:hypothetical protein
MRQLTCWGCRFETTGIIDVCLLCLLCFQVEFSATIRPLVQRSPTDFGVSECDLETSKMWGPRSTRTVESWKQKYRQKRIIELQVGVYSNMSQISFLLTGKSDTHSPGKQVLSANFYCIFCSFYNYRFYRLERFERFWLTRIRQTPLQYVYTLHSYITQTINILRILIILTKF